MGAKERGLAWSLDTRDELESAVSLEYKGRETIALTDTQYVAGQGVADCLDALVLAYLTQHLTNQRFDAALGRGGVTRRYIPHLCYLRGDELVGLSTYAPQNSVVYSGVLEAWNRTGDFPRWTAALDEAEEEHLPLDWDDDAREGGLSDEEEIAAVVSDEIPWLVERLNREEHEERTRRAGRTRALLAESRSPLLPRLRRLEIDDGLREMAKAPVGTTTAADIKVERRWILDRNHPELYQQSHRKLFGKVPSWVFYQTYNDLRRRKASMPWELVEDPYAGGRPDLLDPDVETSWQRPERLRGKHTLPAGNIEIGRLDEFGLATLAEYRCARLSYDYRQSHEWYVEMCRRAIDRGNNPKQVNEWVEQNSFWITPSSQAEFTTALQAKLRFAFTRSDDDWDQMDRQSTQVWRETAMSHRAPVSQIADRLCEVMNSFSHIENGYSFKGKIIDWSSSSVVYPTVEELRDMVRDNENFAQTRSNASAYEAGLLDHQRAGRAKDGGVGGRRSGVIWWNDLKMRLLWSLLHREPYRDSEQRLHRYSASELAIDDPHARAEAWATRNRELLGVAVGIVHVHRERRPADSAIFASLLLRKAVITQGSEKIIAASRRAEDGAGYLRDDLMRDLAEVDDRLPESLFKAELAWFVDPREVMQAHRGIYSWYLMFRQNFYTVQVDRRLFATERDFARHGETLRAIFQRQQPGPFLEGIEVLASRLEADRVVDTLSPLKTFYQQYPGKARMARGGDAHGLVPIELWFEGEDLGVGRDDLERIIERYRRRAIIWMRRRAAEMTYLNGARQFTPAVFARWRDQGFPFRAGDDAWSDGLYRDLGRQAWLNGVYDALIGRAEATGATGGWNDPMHIEWERSQILSRRLDSWYASGKWLWGEGTQALRDEGKAVRSVTKVWVSEWLEDFAVGTASRRGAKERNSRALADLIIATRPKGQGYAHNLDEVRELAKSMICPEGEWSDVASREQQEQLDAVVDIWCFVRNHPRD